MDLQAHYDAVIQRHIGRKRRRGDGLRELDIKRREKQLALRLPHSLRTWYRLAGRLSRLNKYHNLLYDLPELRVEEGYLVFMEENQAVVHWCFRLTELDQLDPVVWQRNNAEPPSWHSEELPFSQFISKMLDWQAGFIGFDE